MHAKPEWLPPNYKNWDALLDRRRAQRHGGRQGPRRCERDGPTEAGTSIDIEHPLASFLPFIGRIAGTGPQPISGDTTP